MTKKAKHLTNKDVIILVNTAWKIVDVIHDSIDVHLIIESSGRVEECILSQEDIIEIKE